MTYEVEIRNGRSSVYVYGVEVEQSAGSDVWYVREMNVGIHEYDNLADAIYKAEQLA
jgi:hypothetical protein